MKLVWGAGRAFQLIGLAAMPAAIWAGEIRRSEREAIALFTASMLAFLLGWMLCKVASR